MPLQEMPLDGGLLVAPRFHLNFGRDVEAGSAKQMHSFAEGDACEGLGTSRDSMQIERLLGSSEETGYGERPSEADRSSSLPGEDQHRFWSRRERLIHLSG